MKRKKGKAKKKGREAGEENTHKKGKYWGIQKSKFPEKSQHKNFKEGKFPEPKCDFKNKGSRDEHTTDGPP